jgi:predicted aconitase with swiveling domain
MIKESSKSKVLKGRSLVSGKGRGLALVSEKAVSFLGGIDPISGKINETDSNLTGKLLGGRIFCFPHGHGSTVGSYVIYSLTKRGVGPKAIVNQIADPVVVVGAIIAEIPMVDQIDIRHIRTGDQVEVDGNKGTVTILRKSKH